MENRTERRMPMTYNTFTSRTTHRPSNPTSVAQSSHKTSSSQGLRELGHTNDKSSRSEVSHSKPLREAGPAARQMMSSSRILNKDGSIPRTTDELIARGFEKLREERKKLYGTNEVSNIGDESSNRIISDSSSKSSATYVCSPTLDPSDILLPRPSLNTLRTYSTRPSARREVSAESQDTRSRLRTRLEEHEDKVRAMQAEIAALKRAAILTRELKNEAALEQTAKVAERREARNQQRESRSLERRPVVQEALKSGGNGTGEQDTIAAHQLREPGPAARQKRSGSRILNQDGSIPKTTDELIARGFEILGEDRKKLRRTNEASIRGNQSSNLFASSSSSSSRSSATYVCSPTLDPSGTFLPPPSLNTLRTSSARLSAGREVSAESHDTQSGRQTQAEIAALKRAAILTIELNNEAALEQTSKVTERREVRKQQRESRSLERRPVVHDAVMSGGNGSGEEHTIVTHQARSITDEHGYNKCREGIHTSQQKLRSGPREQGPRYSEIENRKRDLRRRHEKLCLCRDCTPRTQQFVNSLAAKYAAEDSAFYANPQLQRIKSPLTDLKSHSQCRSTQRISKSNAGAKILLSRSVPDIQVLRHGNGTGDPHRDLHEVDYMQKLKDMSEAWCDCYDCKFRKNGEEFERKHAIFPPVDREGVWARGRNAGCWYW